MKETKFRVWLDYCNKFEYPDSITFYSTGIAHGFADYLVDTNKNVTFQWKK